jgi:putative transposase
MDQSLTLTALNKALERGRPEIHHSDQGVQYAANDYVALLKQTVLKSAWQRLGKHGKTVMLNR